MAKRLPEVRSLWEILPKGTEGGKEFSRIVDLLRFHEGRRTGKRVTIFSDSAGDYKGLDGIEDGPEGRVGFQYKFYPSPLSADHRRRVAESLEIAAKNSIESSINKWVLITPQDFVESATRGDGGDVTWFEGLKKKYEVPFPLEHWGHRELQALFLDDPVLCLFYYPALVAEGALRSRTIQELRVRYDAGLKELYRDIQFVGVAVREQKTAQGVAMQEIYIPLQVRPEGVKEDAARRSPAGLLTAGAHNIVLGDPGSGKSTMLRFLALAAQQKGLQERYQVPADPRLPVLVILRRYAHELTLRRDLSLPDYIVETLRGNLALPCDRQFLEYYLESGNAVLLFDGMDELADSGLRVLVRDRIAAMLQVYPHNTAMVTSRFVGYTEPYRFRKEDFGHYEVAPLRLPEMEQFARDWYRARIANEAERERNIADLAGILADPKHEAIRELAENPLILTIIALVHRIEAELPDERVLLYRKCTETLLSTWHNYKYADSEGKKRGRVERRNLFRMEAVAHWMQTRGSGSKRERAVAPAGELKRFVTAYIEKEEPPDPDQESEQVADTFLEFVKERAGLLIEAGDGLYSMVHLTFQEYLTAEYIRRKAGKGGVEAVWQEIGTRGGDPRWHEVIRLLVAGYENREAEAVLVERMLQAKEQPLELLELLGGLLLDGVEAAEERRSKIVPLLIQACCSAASRAELVRILEVLCPWTARLPENVETFESCLAGLSEPSRGLLGTLVTSGERPLAPEVRYFLGETPDEENLAEYQQMVEKQRSFDWLAALDFRTAMAVSLLHGFTELPFVPALAQAFERLLFLAVIGGGPIANFHYYTTLFASRSEGRERARDRILQRDRALDRALDRDRALALARARQRARVLDRARERDRALALALDQPWAWELLIADPGFFTPVLAVIIDGFSLTPAPLWQEFLRVRVLPTLNQRFRLYDRTGWMETTERFEIHQTGEIDLWRAAHYLLVDGDLWILEVYEEPEESPLRRLAALTREIDFPALRIAHCIRDLSYGDQTKAEEFGRMLKSKDPAYQTIFRGAHLID